LILDEIIGDHDDDKNWADPGVPSGGRNCPVNGNDNEDSEGEEDTPGGEKGTGKGKRKKDGKWNGKGKATKEGKGKGNGKRNSLVNPTPGVESKRDRMKKLDCLSIQREGKLCTYI
jgi:hypothetical protein